MFNVNNVSVLLDPPESAEVIGKRQRNMAAVQAEFEKATAGAWKPFEWKSWEDLLCSVGAWGLDWQNMATVSDVMDSVCHANNSKYGSEFAEESLEMYEESLIAPIEEEAARAECRSCECASNCVHGGESSRHANHGVTVALFIETVKMLHPGQVMCPSCGVSMDKAELCNNCQFRTDLEAM